MAKGTLNPLNARCALATAITTNTGTATACPSPNDWTRGEVAAYSMGEPGGYTALFHDRGASATASLSMDCYARAAAVGAVN